MDAKVIKEGYMLELVTRENDDYLNSLTDADLDLCPRCGNGVDWSCSRDINVFNYSINCYGCDLQVFHSDTVGWLDLTHKEVGDFDERLYCLAKDQYNDWCSHKPTRYCDESWVHYTDKE